MKPSCPIDQATDLETLQRDHAIAHQLASSKRPYSPNCLECGVFIPVERQNILGGTDICVDCAGMK